MNQLSIFIKALVDLPEVSLENFMNICKITTCKKDDFLLRAGEKANYFYFIKSGIVRSYKTDSNGKEHTRNFFLPMMATGALSSLIQNKPSDYSYSCLLDCELYEICYVKFKKLADEDLHLSILFNKMLEKSFLKLEAKIFDLSILNATERYFKLRAEIPNIDQLVTQYNIASYLNITPVQLSRIRKDIVTKK